MARRYENIETYTTNDGKIIYLPTKYPSVVPSNEDFYIITQATDRLDLIASDFFGDSTLWWVVAMANDLPGDSLVPPPGFQLRIPGNLDNAIQEFNALNS
eukprot:SAG11_NODE_2_length_63684_cov_167.801195_50_plen_100_part_00